MFSFTSGIFTSVRNYLACLLVNPCNETFRKEHWHQKLKWQDCRRYRILFICVKFFRKDYVMILRNLALKLSFQDTRQCSLLQFFVRLHTETTIVLSLLCIVFRRGIWQTNRLDKKRDMKLTYSREWAFVTSHIKCFRFQTPEKTERLAGVTVLCFWVIRAIRLEFDGDKVEDDEIQIVHIQIYFFRFSS